MKRLWVLLSVCVLLVAVLSGCFNYSPKGWQEITLETLNGRFCVPPDWVLEESADNMYFTNGKEGDEKEYYLFQWHFKESDETNLLCKTLIEGEFLSGMFYSSGAGYGESNAVVDGVEQTIKFVDIVVKTGIRRFYVWNDSVSLETLKKIARSSEITY